ncbi:homoserine O-acetyltransferase [Thermodesulfobacteriota bacterium]
MIVAPKLTLFSEPLLLESGRTLDRFEMAYETYGSLNRDKDNAILICHGLTADAHAAGRHAESESRPGWWDSAIGTGKVFDTERFFVLCSNVLGGCGGSTGPSSPDPDRGIPYGLRFPVVTVGDMVQAQVRLTERLGIQRIHTIVGGCFGGYQVMEWMRTFSHRAANAIVISATPKTSAHTLGLWEVLRQAIMRDPDFNGGDYYGKELPRSGMGLAQMFGVMIWMSRDVMQARFGRKFLNEAGPSYSLEPDFEFQEFLHKVGRGAVGRFDPNSLLYLTKAMDYFDVSSVRESLTQAFSATRCRSLLISYRSDWRYPPGEMESIRTALAENGLAVEHRVLDSDFGHGAFMYDSHGALQVISEFLASHGLK